MSEQTTKSQASENVKQSSSQENLSSYQQVTIDVKSLLDAGAHYGHQVERWNPRMLPFIYGQRTNIHIINLDLTVKLWAKARKFVVDKMSQGGNILFVGTKHQARDIIREQAQRCGAHYVNSRWLGGTLSNFQTIKNSIERMRKMEEFLQKSEEENTEIRLSKKEKLSISREVEKLEANLGGIRDMKKVPDVVFVVDISKDHIAVSEANRLHIPVVALVDTNTDPSKIKFAIPSNDDSSKTIRLFVSAIADAVIEGKKDLEARQAKQAAEAPVGGKRGAAKNPAVASTAGEGEADAEANAAALNT
jgi:small subunit ribosomal protein S2